MKQHVLPIKDTNILHEVQDTLLNNFRYGRRNYTIFQIGKAALLRVSDVLALRRNEIFDDNGTIKKNAYIRDKKTNKPNILYLKPVKQDLLDYYAWLQNNNIQSEWLFPSITHQDQHITEKQFYKIMAKTGDLLGINYLGTHTKMI
ncbi:integrase [Limosilactobacillus reuteri]|nr:integrase [Limosilactobacillus reuteri]